MNKVFKLIGILLGVVIAGFAIIYAVLEITNKDDELKAYEEIEIYTLSGPTGFAVSKLLESKDYSLKVFEAPDKISAAIIKGDAKFATVPTNLAAILNKKTNGKIKILSVISEGNLYVLTTNEEVDSFEDLNGKTVALAGAGATPEVIAKDLLPDSELDFKSEHAECVALLKSGKADVIILPEPYVTVCKKQIPEVKVVADLTEHYTEKHGDILPMSALVFNSEYLDYETADEIIDDIDNDGEIETLPYVTGEERVEKLLKDVEASISWVNENVNEAEILIEDNGILSQTGVASEAIPGCNLVFKRASDAKETITKYFEIINEIYPNLIGGSVPDEEIYY